jgi:hypothetical protein
VRYQKKEEFEIKELNIDLDVSEENQTDHPATSIVKIIMGSVIVIITMAAALAVYGVDHDHPELLILSDKILEIPHYITDTGRDWLIHLQETK